MKLYLIQKKLVGNLPNQFLWLDLRIEDTINYAGDKHEKVFGQKQPF